MRLLKRLLAKLSFKRSRDKTQTTGGFCFLCLDGKDHEENIPLPVNFDLDEILRQYPPVEHCFPADIAFVPDKALALLWLISSIATRNRDLIDAKGFTPIYAKKVQNSIRDYQLYWAYLVRSGVVETNNHYYKGRSKGYRWAEQFRNAPFSLRKVKLKYSDDIHLYEKFIRPKDTAKHPYLFHWYDTERLNILPEAEQYAYNLKVWKMSDKHRWDTKEEEGKIKRKYPISQYMSNIYGIGKIQLNQYEPHIDHTSHRLHSVLTNMQTDIRNFVNYDGQKLVSIDIKNSQPYLSTLILRREFWDVDSTLPVNINILPENVAMMFSPASEVWMKIAEYLLGEPPENFVEYSKLAASGLVYEEMMQKAKGMGKEILRKDAKTAMFYILFSSNKSPRAGNELPYDLKKMFNEKLFPAVGKLFHIIKGDYDDSELGKQYSRLAILLQTIESEIVLHRCCKRIWEERNQQIPIFTIHDSIATTLPYVDYVESVIKDEMGRCIGIEPKLEKEEWDVQKLRAKIDAITPPNIT